MSTSLINRGLEAKAQAEQQRAEGVAYNIEEGQRQIRRAFVFGFYHDTMVDTHLSGAGHKFGPDSPYPDIRPTVQPHSLGGGYHGVDWVFVYEGIKWAARWSYSSGWRLDFYVRGRQQVNAWRFRTRFLQRARRAAGLRDWQIVHSPAQVVEAFA